MSRVDDTCVLRRTSPPKMDARLAAVTCFYSLVANPHYLLSVEISHHGGSEKD